MKTVNSLLGWKFLVLVIIAIPRYAIAQDSTRWALGFHTGLVGSTWLSNSSFREAFDLEYATKYGFMVGVSAEHHFNMHAYLAIDLNYERKGNTVISEAYDYFGNPIGKAYNPIRFDYMVLPVMFRYEFGQKETTFFIEAGGYGGHVASTRLHYRGTMPTYDFYESMDPDLYQEFDYGLVFGLGIQVECNEHSKFIFELRNSLGLHRLGKGSESMDEDARNESLALILGMNFSVGAHGKH